MKDKPRLMKCDECEKDGNMTDGASLWLCFQHAISYCQEQLDNKEKMTYCRICKKNIRGDLLVHCSMEHYAEVEHGRK